MLTLHHISIVSSRNLFISIYPQDENTGAGKYNFTLEVSINIIILHPAKRSGIFVKALVRKISISQTPFYLLSYEIIWQIIFVIFKDVVIKKTVLGT